MNNYFKYLMLAMTIASILEDKKIDETEEDLLIEQVAPIVAKFTKGNDDAIRILVKLAKKVIAINETTN